MLKTLLGNLLKPGTTTIIITTVVWWHGGVGKARFQQSGTAHSRTGEKETLNKNVVGKKETNIYTRTDVTSLKKQNGIKQ